MSHTTIALCSEECFNAIHLRGQIPGIVTLCTWQIVEITDAFPAASIQLIKPFVM